MNNRIQNLRENSLKATNQISDERALLVTEFYQSGKYHDQPVPVQRARAFEYILLNKEIYIGEGELIVGERGPYPKATPTYPEISLHTTKDLEILNTRPKVSFKVNEDTFQTYKDIIIPFWKGKTNRERIFDRMDDNWLSAYKAGIFTEFQEQRAPGHTVCGDKIYKKGMSDIINDIRLEITRTVDKKSEIAKAKKAELQAMEISANAIISFAQRHSSKLLELADNESDDIRREELMEMADICSRVPSQKPQTFHEALQYYWFVHLGVITELNPWDSFNPGRLDQHLYPFYKKELNEGSITKERAVELLQAFWIKFNNHPSPPKVGVTALESNTYTDFSLINTGGVDVNGDDATNELTYIILDVIRDMRLLQPSSMVQISKKSPHKLAEKAFEIIKTGFGQPSLFNTDAIIEELTRQGKSLEDARNGGASGCVESGAFGVESYILTGYFNLTKILEVTLNNGIDPSSDEKIGIEAGSADSFASFAELMEAYKKQLAHFINIKVKGSNTIESIFAEYLPVPFMSLIIDDCVSNATDYNCGGARYNTNYIQGVGLGSITDCLASIKYNVYDQPVVYINEFIKALHNNFKGYEELRYRCIYDTPKYGNDDDYADELAVEVFNAFFDAVDGRPSPRGATYRINMLPTTSHVYFGSVIGAMPDGRLAGEPLSEGISPFQGADINGPTAVLKSAAKIDHFKTGGTLLNQKFTPSFFKSERSIEKIIYLVRSYFKMNGHHIQFNVVDSETLKEAQKSPEKYRDLIVRVAGYSDYFNDLGVDLQNEIIRRTEQDT